MKKKGFTLIELLAVIVILAIIALILIPKINDLIESSRYASAVDSVLSYVSGANNQAAADVGIGGFENFSLSIPDTLELETGIDDDELEKIQYKGKGPTYVYLHFAGADKYVAEGKFCIWGYSIDYDSDEGATRSLLNYCEEKEPEGELTCDVLNNNAYDSTTNFKIKSVEDLVCISEMSKSGKNFSGKTIYLAKNIDFNNNASYLNINDKTYGDINGDGTIDGIKTEVTTAAGFLPIGSSTTFTGTFEGYGKSISNLYINRDQTGVGLFGNNQGKIVGLMLFDVNIKGGSRVGAVAGNNNGGTINEVIISGKVTGTGNDIGGAVGYQNRGSVATSILIRDIEVTGSESAGIVSDGWYSTVTGVVESGNISYRCTTDNTGAASVTVRCSNKTTYSNEGNWGTSYNLIPPTTVTYTSSGNTIEVDSLSYYDSVGVLDTYIGGDGDETGYYMDYNNSGDRIIAVKASSSSGSSSGGSGSGSGSGGAGEPIIGDSVGTNPPTCVLERVIPRSAGIQAILTCEDEEGAPTIRSQWNVNKNATTTQFSDIGIVKEGSVNGNSKTVSPYWSTSNTISVPTPNTCYYYRFGAMDASGNWSYYVSDKCYYGFSN